MQYWKSQGHAYMVPDYAACTWWLSGECAGEAVRTNRNTLRQIVGQPLFQLAKRYLAVHDDVAFWVGRSDATIGLVTPRGERYEVTPEELVA